MKYDTRCIPVRKNRSPGGHLAGSKVCPIRMASSATGNNLENGVITGRVRIYKQSIPNARMHQVAFLLITQILPKK
jgi:hypothetical protein